MKKRLQTLYKNRNFRIITPIIIGVILLISLIILLVPGAKNPQNTISAYDKLPKATPYQAMGNMKGMQMNKQLAVDVTFAKTSLQITNTERIDLQKCSLTVNAGMVQSGYTVTKAVLPSHTPLTVQYAELMHYGVHFNPDKQKVVDLMVMCRDAKNSGWKYFGNH